MGSRVSLSPTPEQGALVDLIGQYLVDGGAALPLSVGGTEALVVQGLGNLFAADVVGCHIEYSSDHLDGYGVTGFWNQLLPGPGTVLNSYFLESVGWSTAIEEAAGGILTPHFLLNRTYIRRWSKSDWAMLLSRQHLIYTVTLPQVSRKPLPLVLTKLWLPHLIMGLSVHLISYLLVKMKRLPSFQCLEGFFSYKKWSQREESNLRPAVYETVCQCPSRSFFVPGRTLVSTRKRLLCVWNVKWCDPVPFSSLAIS